jgi:hypothetical protein
MTSWPRSSTTTRKRNWIRCRIWLAVLLSPRPVAEVVALALRMVAVEALVLPMATVRRRVDHPRMDLAVEVGVTGRMERAEAAADSVAGAADQADLAVDQGDPADREAPVDCFAVLATARTIRVWSART